MAAAIRINWEEAVKQFEYCVRVNGAAHVQTDAKGHANKWFVVVGLDHDTESLVCRRWDTKYKSLHAKDTKAVALKASELDNWKCQWFQEAVNARERFNERKNTSEQGGTG